MEYSQHIHCAGLGGGGKAKCRGSHPVNGLHLACSISFHFISFHQSEVD